MEGGRLRRAPGRGRHAPDRVHRAPRPQYRIAEPGVEIEGNRAIPIEQLRPALVKLQANDMFVESNLSAAVSAIAGQYQRLGFAQAKMAAAVNEVIPGRPARSCSSSRSSPSRKGR